MDLDKIKEHLFNVMEINHSYLAIIGENRKMLIIKTEEIPNLKKGKGALLQKYKAGKISDACLLNTTDPITYLDNNNEITILTNWVKYIAARGSIVKIASINFNKLNILIKN